MSDTYNSDEERYADDTFEQEDESDAEEVPEVPEIGDDDSALSDEDTDQMPSVKSVILNTRPMQRTSHDASSRSPIYPHRHGRNNTTDCMPFDSSSDEEDNVVVGLTMAEINTPSMHMMDVPNFSSSKALELENNDIEEQSGSSVSDVDSDEEREFQKIRDMEERYIQHTSAHSAHTPKTAIEKESHKQAGAASDDELETESDEEIEVETDIRRTQRKLVRLEEQMSLESAYRKTSSTPHARTKSKYEQSKDHIPNLIDKVMETISPQSQLPAEMQTNIMELIQDSLNKLIAGSSGSQSEMSSSSSSFMDGKNLPLPSATASEPMTNAEKIASVLITAMSATNLNVNHMADQLQKADAAAAAEAQSFVQNEIKSEEQTKQTCVVANEGAEALEKKKDNEMVNGAEGQQIVDEADDTTPRPQENDGNCYEEGTYSGHFNYEITSKPPSCFASDDYVFHTNFVRPSVTADRSRPRPMPRKSMSFSNERMREIERHNQILLRKILTQKPTYSAKKAQPKSQSSRTPPQPSNDRPTTSALNRKKQQRQIDLDNQVLKRKIEAISLRRRPLIS